jgi:transglutaminase-like putative cysteine protease
MLIRVGYDIIFDIPQPAPMMLALNIHPSRWHDIRKPEGIVVEPYAPITFFNDSYGNTCGHLLAPAGRVRFYNDAVVEDSGNYDEAGWGAEQHPIEDLPGDVLHFLLASRYCEVDLMTPIAWDLFGRYAPGWGRAQAIVDWVHNHLRFDYQLARSTRTAYEGYQEKVGVCRDFTHLAITMCRCMNIPARYSTGYLGDIGVPPVPAPMDFSAWFEVYMGGRWWTLDARHNKPRIGRIVMARGRDATDCALTTAFGPTSLRQFKVWTDEVSGY